MKKGHTTKNLQPKLAGREGRVLIRKGGKGHKVTVGELQGIC